MKGEGLGVKGERQKMNDGIKKYVVAVLAAWYAMFAAAGASTPSALAPQPYYGRIAQEVIKRLERKHVLRRPFDDEMSRRAWTNLVSNYD